jgi:hypothetical protein
VVLFVCVFEDGGRVRSWAVLCAERGKREGE